MALKVAISGFGRIGRNVLRAAAEAKRRDLEFVAINDLVPAKDNAHLFKYDSVHGTFAGDVKVDGDTIDVGLGAPIKVLAEKDPSKLPWKELGIDIVMECTGIFTDKDKAKVHLDAGAKRVLVSAPSKGADLTVVYGVNHDKLTGDHKVVSNASCTTNCLAPVAKVLHDLVGIKSGFMTTIHSYTNDQRILDQAHKDMRRARAAALSLIPTSTGRRRCRRPRAARAQGQARRHIHSRADAERLRGGPEVHPRPRDHRRGDQQGDGARLQAAVEGHPAVRDGRARLDRLQSLALLVELRFHPDADRRRQARCACSPGTTTSGASPTACSTPPSSWASCSRQQPGEGRRRRSRRAPSPRRVATASGAENIGPATTQVWNSPFSPHGSTPSGRSASSCASNARPAKDAGSFLGSTHVRCALSPPAIISRASSAVSRPHNGNSGAIPLPASFASPVGADVLEEQIAERHGRERRPPAAPRRTRQARAS